MPSLVYVGDKTSHGGVVLSGSARVTKDGRGAARKTDRVSCPKCGENMIVQGDDKIRDGDLPLAFHGYKTACGATLIASTSNTGSA
ncbi:putative Zn-binding protein involved in type VI secretion [Silvimonas terrae]|uniref:Putative Zn-binding protein involved in type VI secretion n=1 Tax=Silvimonas terrae TaxID=300266 RepID=A0A840RKZ2_9NEIS|nr:PAAR domain-containing protein [Silvimonas terrae]MBB5192801.1 putative Zn-binding protein involved in type VI secretion [Silvimonas terrae]